MIDLRLGDCLDVMQTMPDGSIDLVLADLPYGTTACKWDTVIPFEPLWAHYRRLLKPRGAVVLTASQPFTSTLVMSNREWFRYCWSWDKGAGSGFLDANRRPLRCHEDICMFALGRTTYNPQKRRGAPTHGRKAAGIGGRQIYRAPFRETGADTSGMKFPRSIIRIHKHTSREKLHPTQKPVALMEYLIRTYTDEGETVLDNAMGSGTTGVACLNTDRSFVGIELDPGYFAVASKRIEAARFENTHPLLASL